MAPARSEAFVFRAFQVLLGSVQVAMNDLKAVAATLRQDQMVAGTYLSITQRL